jgi:hypothetical protein
VFPPQQGQLGGLNGPFEVHGRKRVGLFAVDVGDPIDGNCLDDGDALVLNAPQLCQDGFGGRGLALAAGCCKGEANGQQPVDGLGL